MGQVLWVNVHFGFAMSLEKKSLNHMLVLLGGTLDCGMQGVVELQQDGSADLVLHSGSQVAALFGPGCELVDAGLAAGHAGAKEMTVIITLGWEAKLLADVGCVSIIIGCDGRLIN